jgi:hypothetical protein
MGHTSAIVLIRRVLYIENRLLGSAARGVTGIVGTKLGP